jgi:hypothetical protein
MSAYCTQSRLFGLKATNPDFWVINPEFDGITKLTYGRFKVRKGMYCGIYDTTLFRWLIPVQFAWIRQDRAGNYWVRRTINSPERLYQLT